MTTKKRQTTTPKKRRYTPKTTRTNSTAKWLALIIPILAAAAVFFQWDKLAEILNGTQNPPTTTQAPPPKTQPVPAPSPSNLPNNTPSSSASNIKCLSWNLFNFSTSKTDFQIRRAADITKDYDLLAIQEISTSPEGAKAVAKLLDELNRRGEKWDYTLSPPTTGDGKERYAYLWKTRKLTLASPAFLSKSLANTINREPYLARFKTGNTTLLAVNFHAVTASKQPENEVLQLINIHKDFKNDNIIFMGDFNLSQKDAAFEELKKEQFTPVLINQKTSLKQTHNNGNYFSNEFDNIFIENPILKLKNKGIIDFPPYFRNYKEARDLSDHVPVWCEIAF